MFFLPLIASLVGSMLNAGKSQTTGGTQQGASPPLNAGATASGVAAGAAAKGTPSKGFMGGMGGQLLGMGMGLLGGGEQGKPYRPPQTVGLLPDIMTRLRSMYNPKF